MSIALNLPRALLAGLLLTDLLLSPFASAGSAVLQEVTVSATRLREQPQLDVPASITVLSEQALTDSAQQHFQEVLAQIPNLNWAAASSRPRYFQLRGIGEREQYEGAPNSSVGFLIDDIDFSGVGMAATLFDVDQVEVLRGPQGTRLGANALAGVIAIHTADPGNNYNARVAADIGDYDTRSLGFSATGPVESLDSSWRLAVQNYRSDGFRTNTFLGRQDTNGRDELTARGKWRWQPSESGQLDLTFMHANLANGYDAFSIDNSRVTLSDQPGEDSQRANAGAVKWTSTFTSGSALTLIATALDSTSVHAFDADWGNPQSFAPYDYSYVYSAERTHDTQTLEARFASAPIVDSGAAWLFGAYAMRLREGIEENTNYSDPLLSRYQATNAALFAQLDGRFAQRWVWASGLRGEQRQADYSDTRPAAIARTDRMVGGNVSLTYEVTKATRFYSAISRGYKAGGFNLGSAAALHPEFEPEFLWNYELGVKTQGLEGRLYADTTLFYMQRDNMQVRSGEQSDPSDPTTYIFITTNVARGYNYGVESSVRWLPNAQVELGASFGLLKTQESGSVDNNGQPIASRAQAHAPEYQAQLNATYRHPRGLMARIDYSAMDKFYFDVPADHDQQSQAYALTHIKVGYETLHWSIYGWMRNVFDKVYATRGFFFANEPPDFNDKLYIQNGDPRQIGVSVQWSLR
jgi:iron complex outermembrane recepter protein